MDEGAKKFVQEHELYYKALGLFDYDDIRYRKIADLYGDFLTSVGKYQEAGIMFTKGENYKEALNCFIFALSWRDCIATAMKLQLR